MGMDWRTRAKDLSANRREWALIGANGGEGDCFGKMTICLALTGND
jgi:hypothetical protein